MEEEERSGERELHQIWRPVKCWRSRLMYMQATAGMFNLAERFLSTGTDLNQIVILRQTWQDDTEQLYTMSELAMSYQEAHSSSSFKALSLKQAAQVKQNDKVSKLTQ